MPKVDGLGLKILFLLIPGIIGFFIVKAVGPKRPRTDLETGLQIFVYGVASYAVSGLIEGVYIWITSSGLGFWKTIFDKILALATLNPDIGLGSDQVAFSTIVAVLIGAIVTLLQTYSIPHRVLRRLGLTKRTSEVDVWSFTFNSPDLDSWVTVRHANGKVYQGWVRGYSDGADERELVLADVTVWVQSNEEPDKLLEVDSIPVVYFGLDRKNSIIELRPVR